MLNNKFILDINLDKVLFLSPFLESLNPYAHITSSDIKLVLLEASLISPALKDQEISKMKNKPKKNISAWDEYMQGLNIINNNPNTSEIRDKVMKHCKKAIDLDANFCDAYILYCGCLTMEIYDPNKIKIDGANLVFNCSGNIKYGEQNTGQLCISDTKSAIKNIFDHTIFFNVSLIYMASNSTNLIMFIFFVLYVLKAFSYNE